MKDFTTSQENGNADVMDKVEDWEIYQPKPKPKPTGWPADVERPNPHFLPVCRQTKRLLLDRWRDNHLTAKEAIKAARPDGAIAVVPSTAFGYVIDIDEGHGLLPVCDWLEERGVTFEVFPSKTDERFHVWCYSPGLARGNEYHKFGDIRSSNGYLILWELKSWAAKWDAVCRSKPAAMTGEDANAFLAAFPPAKAKQGNGYVEGNRNNKLNEVVYRKGIRGDAVAAIRAERKAKAAGLDATEAEELTG